METRRPDGDGISSWRQRLRPVMSGSIKLHLVGPGVPEIPASIWRNCRFLMRAGPGAQTFVECAPPILIIRVHASNDTEERPDAEILGRKAGVC